METSRLGRYVLRERRRMGLSQSQLADQAGLPQAAISRIERGHDSISLATARGLARGLGVALGVIGVLTEGDQDG